MKNKRHLVLVLFLLIISISVIFYFYQDYTTTKVDVVKINDIIESIKSNWNNIDQDNLPGKEYSLDYSILDRNDNFIASTNPLQNHELITAIKNSETIIYLTENDTIIGKVIFYTNPNLQIKNYRLKLLIVSITFLILIFIANLIYSNYIDRSILKPFRKLQGFSHQISLGNLDFPLDMDKYNLFGAFTESFDIMRTELNKAKVNEMNANKSKKELIASLSHDIKTPIASIKSVCDILSVKINDQDQLNQIEVINSKVEQINTLITNLFNATLEELQELKVNLMETSSNIIYEIIKKSDYYNKCQINKIPECLVLIDKIRLEQVIDNIISNSYKYANTDITVNVKTDNEYLEIEFKDYGTSINESEVLLLSNKYYRGENSKGKNGTGLGLYISKYFMAKMNGELNISIKDGFSVTLKILIF
jgi:signal transduction histidine kinase